MSPQSGDSPGSIEDLVRLRAAHAARRAEQSRRLQFITDDEWLTIALSGDLPGMESTANDILISAGASGDTLGQHWAGLLVIDPVQRRGHAWFNEIAGHGFDEAAVYAGNAVIPGPNLDRLLEILESNPLDRFCDVPPTSYGGATTGMQICDRINPRIYKATADSDVRGTEPAVQLASVVWAIKRPIEQCLKNADSETEE